MTDNKENSKKTVLTSMKCIQSKTQLKDVNSVFRNTHSESKKNFNICSVRSYYSLRSYSQRAVPELFRKTALDSNKIELEVSTKKVTKVNIPASSASRNDLMYRLQTTQSKQPEGNKFRQMLGRQNGADNTLLAEGSTLLSTDCEIRSDIGNDVISSFSNMSMSRGSEDCKDMYSNSMLTSPSIKNEHIMQVKS